MFRLSAFMLVLFLVLFPLVNPLFAAVPNQDGSPWDDIARWFENALEDIQFFFDNLGENLTRIVEDMAASLRNIGQALQDQFNRAVEGVGTD
jgi:predicted PurR-regulated permease PerM